VKFKLVLFVLLFSAICAAQENCNNGIDDDGDGKIDLNDSDCICNISAVTSIIPNPSFETKSGCPTSFSQLNLATPWIQATEATTDYYNKCGFVAPGITSLGLDTFADGDGIAGALFLTDWNEYLGAPLSSPMIAGTNYQLTLNIAALKIYNNGTLSTVSNVDSMEPVNVTLYGCANSKNLPLNIVSSPNLADPTWIEIGKATYTPISSWGEITISFTPSTTINAIMLGAPPVLPKSYPSTYGIDYPYFLFDNLLLNTSESFGVNITQAGNFCENNLVLKANLTKNVSSNATYQWYHNGIAIIGANEINYTVQSFTTNLGNYSVKVTDGSNCFISTKSTINNTISGPSSTNIQPNCIVTTGSITITTPASQFSFDNGTTWQDSPTKDLLAVGTYFIKIKTQNGCVSSANGVSLIEPQLLSGSNFVVTQPSTCNGKGSITINSTIAKQYSFDDGATWTVNSTADNLEPGNYLIRIKDEAGCQSASQNAIINRVYLDNPTYTLVQPICGTGGKITITTTSSFYSFDDGVTWTTNPVAKDLDPGSYTIKIKNELGCESYSQYVYIYPFYLDSYPTYTATQPICGTKGSITITTTASEYSFDGGITWSTNPTATNLDPGNYPVMFKNDLGCLSQIQYVYLNYFYLDNPEYEVVQPICGTGGTITITTLADFYSFDGGVTWTTNPIATNLASGTHLIMIKNNLGCTSYYQYVNLDYYYLPNPEFIAVNPSCGNIGSITITTPAAQYSFDGGTTWTTNPTANNLPSGYYTIKIKNALGCESNYMYVYLDSNYLANPNYTLVQPGCGTKGSISITTVASQYSFDGGNTWTTNPVATNLDSGYYYLVIKNATGCISYYLYVYLEPYYLENPNFTVVQPSCGVAGKISITTIADQYSFDNGNTWSTNPVASNLEAGYYYIMTKNSLGCVSRPQYTYINPFYLDDPTYTVTQPICGTGGTITITTIAAQYSFDNGNTWTTNPVASNLDSGYYYILIKNNLGCVSSSQFVYLNTFYLDNPTYTVTQPVCGTGGIITITTVAAQYSFDNGNTWSTNPVASNLTSGYYYILIKNNLGCVSNSQYVYINQYFLANPTYTVVQPSCETKGTITITTPAAQYSFDNGNTWTTNPVATNLASNYYYIKIKNALGCESDYQYVYIYSTPNVPANPAVTSVQPSSCGAKDGSITVTSSAYSYSFDNGITWGNNSTLSSLGAETYLVKVKNSYDSCPSPATSVTLNSVNNLLAAPAYSTIQPNCVTNTGTITINTVAAQYSFDDGVTFTNSNSLSNLIVGPYLIKIKNSAGCISLANSVVISAVTPLPAPTYTIDQPSCKSDTGTKISIKIDTSAAEYSLDNGVTWTTNPFFDNLQADTDYFLKIKDASGCLSNNLIVHTIVQNPTPNPPSITISQPSSCNSSTGFITVNTSAFQYSFDNGETWSSSPISSALSMGTYFVRTKENSNSCPSEAKTAIIDAPPNAPENPTISITQPISCVSPFGSIQVTSSAFQYSFDDGNTYSANPNSALLTAGTYLVKVKNSSNCESKTVSATIIPPTDYPLAPTFTILQPDCSNSKGKITVTSSASEYSFDNGITWSSSSTSNLLIPHNYLIKIKNANGCISNASTAIVIPFTNFTVTPTATSPKSFCIQENATLNSIAITGQNIKWYDASINGKILANNTLLQNSSTYYASQTINGCESERTSVLINILNTPAPTGNSQQSFCSSQNPTLNSILATGSSLKWYDSPTAVSILPISTPLQGGATYYASQTLNNCESPTKLAVTISLISTLPANNYEELFCDDLNNGTETVDLSSYNSKVISNTTDYNFAYYISRLGAEKETTSDKITNFSNYKLVLGDNKIYVRINSNTTCFAIAELKLTLFSNPIININNTVPICENNTIKIDAGAGFDSYLWSNGEKTSSITTSQVGNYTVTVTQNHGNIVCNSTKNFKVVLSNVAKITNIETRDWTDNENIIIVNISTSSFGDYEYSIDGLNYQTSNQFTGLISGEYTVWVRDQNGCGTTPPFEVYLLMFPRFFTPNGDNHNDTWKIKFSDNEVGLTVKIFDRYGKLIKMLSNSSDSWNGTFNDQPLPSTDYWFVVTRANGQQLKGHFSLKR